MALSIVSIKSICFWLFKNYELGTDVCSQKTFPLKQETIRFKRGRLNQQDSNLKLQTKIHRHCDSDDFEARDESKSMRRSNLFPIF
jgi:hypothetical protein